MTTKVALFFACLVALAATLACTTGRSSRRGGLEETEVQALPPKVQDAYSVFAIKCSRCHTLSRPLNAAIYEYGHWENYVARMRHHAGSGISPNDAQTVLVFLRYYADQQAVQAGLRPASTSSTSGVTL